MKKTCLIEEGRGEGGGVDPVLKYLTCTYINNNTCMFILKGASSYGFWVEHNNDGRCILKCDDGYEPSGCYVLRY